MKFLFSLFFLFFYTSKGFYNSVIIIFIMKYVVTGGAGFIGSHIVEELVKKGDEVTVIDNLSFGKIDNIKSVLNKIRFINGDIMDLELLKKEFKGKDFVLHQAALKSVPKSFENPEEYEDVNENGTLNVLKAALENNVKKFVFASSSSVYGDCNIFPQKENFAPEPKSPYAKTKLEAEKICYEFSKKGLGTVSLRYFNVFGPKQDPNSEYAAVIPKFITSILNNKQPIVYGNGNQSRDFTFVKNVVHANIKACEKDVNGEIINIACGKETTINCLLKKINNDLGKNIKAKYEKERKGDVKHTLADISKQKRLLKLEPEYNFDAGLKETIEWFKRVT